MFDTAKETINRVKKQTTEGRKLDRESLKNSRNYILKTIFQPINKIINSIYSSQRKKYTK